MSNGSTRLDSEHYYLSLRILQIATMAIFQIGIPFFFISEFGISGYGQWVISVSIVSFLGFFDFGLFNSVINDAIAFRTLGKNESAKSLLETLSKFTVFMSIVLTLVILFLDAVLPFLRDADNLIMILALGAILQTVIRLNEAVSRAYLHASGFAVLVTSYIFESILLILAIHLQFQFVAIATLVVCSRFLFVGVGFFFNRNRVSLFKVIKLNVDEIFLFLQHNIGKGLAFFALPVGYIILFDFSNVILGSVISKEFVAELSLLRISTGIIRQFSSAILASYSPSLSQAIFSGDARVLMRLHQRMRLTLIVTISIISVLLLFSSNLIFSYYFKGATLLSIPIFLLFALSVILDIPWNYRSTLLFAANMHEGIAKRFLLSSVLAVVAIYFLGPLLGFLGVIISFSLQDVLLTRYAFKKSSIFLQSHEINPGGKLV